MITYYFEETDTNIETKIKNAYCNMINNVSNDLIDEGFKQFATNPNNLHIGKSYYCTIAVENEVSVQVKWSGEEKYEEVTGYNVIDTSNSMGNSYKIQERTRTQRRSHCFTESDYFTRTSYVTKSDFSQSSFSLDRYNCYYSGFFTKVRPKNYNYFLSDTDDNIRYGLEKALTKEECCKGPINQLSRKAKSEAKRLGLSFNAAGFERATLMSCDIENAKRYIYPLYSVSVTYNGKTYYHNFSQTGKSITETPDFLYSQKTKNKAADICQKLLKKDNVNDSFAAILLLMGIVSIICLIVMHFRISKDCTMWQGTIVYILTFAVPIAFFIGLYNFDGGECRKLANELKEEERKNKLSDNWSSKYEKVLEEKHIFSRFAPIIVHSICFISIFLIFLL